MSAFSLLRQDLNVVLKKTIILLFISDGFNKDRHFFIFNFALLNYKGGAS